MLFISGKEGGDTGNWHWTESEWPATIIKESHWLWIQKRLTPISGKVDGCSCILKLYWSKGMFRAPLMMRCHTARLYSRGVRRGMFRGEGQWIMATPRSLSFTLDSSSNRLRNMMWYQIWHLLLAQLYSLGLHDIGKWADIDISAQCCDIDITHDIYTF